MKMVVGTGSMLIQDGFSASAWELLYVLVMMDVMASNWMDIQIGSRKNALPVTTMVDYGLRQPKKATKVA